MPTSEEPEDFAEFVAYRSAGLLRAAWLLTGDAHKAEDLLQTALASTWRHWPKMSRTSDPEVYVRKVLFHTYVSWWRRRWRAEIPTLQVPDRADDRDVAGQAADRDTVRRALGTLSRQQRAIVVLRYVEDFSIIETAAILGCSQQTVKVQASRALAKLRDDPGLGMSAPTPETTQGVR